MLDNAQHSTTNEKFVDRVRDMMLIEALKEGKNEVINDANLLDLSLDPIQKVIG
jgi:hypothetical protein